MSEVHIKENESLDSALRRFKRSCAKAGVLSDMKNVILVSGSGMAGTDSANKITTRKVMSRFYLCGDEKSDIADGCGLMAPRVAVCAAHQATAVMKLILGQSPV